MREGSKIGQELLDVDTHDQQHRAGDRTPDARGKELRTRRKESPMLRTLGARCPISQLHCYVWRKYLP